MNKISVSQEVVMSKIYIVRGNKVMLSFDLAELYQVETRVLNQQVKRNIGRFSERYMFKLTTEEYQSLRSQFVILKRGQHSKYPPYAFTEHGVLMLATVLRSKRADKVNMLIIDTFVEMREILIGNKELLLEMEKIKNQVAGQDEKVEIIFEYLKQLEATKQMDIEQMERNKIGYKN